MGEYLGEYFKEKYLTYRKKFKLAEKNIENAEKNYNGLMVCPKAPDHLSNR